MIKRLFQKRWFRCVLILTVISAFAGWFAWVKFFREGPERAFANETERFKYGSIGGEAETGLPYWIWLVLPRVFPEYLPGSGGYASVGLVWEEGEEMPVGFTKKVVGFPRVGTNCALCHVGTYRSKREEVPTLVTGAPNHTFNPKALFAFFTKAARDPRFNADILLKQIERETDLSFVDTVIYRYLIIPLTRDALLKQGERLEWVDVPYRPEWGPGRDDAFNLPKFVLMDLPDDHTSGQCDINSAWNLKVREGDGRFLNWAGESPTLRTVLVDSSLGMGPKPGAAFEKRIEELGHYMRELVPPSYPFPIDEALRERGRAIYADHCAACHDPGRERTNRIIPIEEIGTDRERLDSWSQADADAFNAKVRELGFDRPNALKNEGYYSPPLDGIWMRAPFLHNGSVPSLRELLNPPAERVVTFHRGDDLYDPENVGFFSRASPDEPGAFLLDTRERGNGKGGHSYGTGLSEPEKAALIEYLKSL